MLNMNQYVGRSHLLMVTLDTLRYDVACEQLQLGQTPHLARILPEKKWQKCHSPASFTYAAHLAFFAGFFPTPATPGRHERLFALKFEGSETVGPNTFVFDSPDIVSGLASEGYRTICIGGVGFFKKQNPLSYQLPSLFQESYWDESMGVTCPDSTRNQVDLACRLLAENDQKPVFMFVNISALHQPNHFYMSTHPSDFSAEFHAGKNNLIVGPKGPSFFRYENDRDTCDQKRVIQSASPDSLQSHAAALRYVDSQLGRLFDAFEKDRDTLMMILSDHGTCYGEEGYTGHRLGHENVWTVPYAVTHRKKS